MLRELLAKLLCCVLIVAVPAAAANTNAAVLAATSSSINGKQVLDTAAVFDGDVIAVANGQATIRLAGSTVNLPANSSVRYAAKQVELSLGAVAVSTRKSMGVRLGQVTIVPAGERARYQVSSFNGVERIQALEGALRISNGVQTYTLPAGKEMTRDLRAAAPQTGAEDFGLPGWAVAGIIAGVAAVAIGVTVAVQGEDSPSTP